MARIVVQGDEARRKLKSGVDQVANAVRVTLGPRGRNVVVQGKKGNLPAAINDGVTIASEVVLADHVEDIGVQLLLQAAARTDLRAGDGTTTATVLTQALMREGLRLTESGFNAIALKSGLAKAADFFVRKIVAVARPAKTFDEVAAVAGISSGNDEMGRIVATALDKVGLDGLTTIAQGVDFDDEVEFVYGMEVETGFINAAFVSEMESQRALLEKPRVLVTDIKVTLLAELLPILEAVVEARQPLLIIATDVVAEALSALILNKDRGVLSTCAIKAPGYGDVKRGFLQDICTYSGATFVSAELGMKLEDVKLDMLGTLDTAEIDKSRALLVSDGTHGELVQERIRELKSQRLELEKVANKEFEVQRLEQRIQKLLGAVARIRVGGATEAETADRMLRYEDAVNAGKGAIAEGIVPGGGATYAFMTRYADECRETLDGDEKAAVDVLVEAMLTCVEQVAHNAGEVGALVREKVAQAEWGVGFNAKTLTYEDLFEAGVCDPVTVSTWALQNAAGIAGSMLTTQAVVYDTEREDPDLEFEPEIQTGFGAGAADAGW